MNLSSALAFYLATVMVHLGTRQNPVSPEFFATVRYLVGFVLFAVIILWQRDFSGRTPLRFVILRSVFNVAAVVCFYRSVVTGETGLANVLNMTYPVFVALLARPLLGEKVSGRVFWLAGLCGSGILLQILGRLGGIITGEAITWGLASGILAALAILSLRGAALIVRPQVILVWMFGIGTLILVPFTTTEWFQTPVAVWPLILVSALLGVAGQFLLTISYRHLDATAGSIVSSARIPLALVIGLAFLGEPFARLAWSGAALIFLSNLLLALLGNRGQPAGQQGELVLGAQESPRSN